MVSSFLLEALSHYKLADEFFSIVGDFVNVAKFVEEQCKDKDKESEEKPSKFTLRILSKKLSSPQRSASSSDSDGQEKEKQEKEKPRNRNRGMSMQSAKTRAECTFRVLQKFVNCEDAEICDIEQLKPFRISREEAFTKLEQQKEQLKEQQAQAKARASSKGDKNEKKKVTKIPDETTVPSSCADGEDLKVFTECPTLLIPSN
jgi:hypothetical protein